MKKIAAAVLSVMLVFALGACSGKSNGGDTAVNTTAGLGTSYSDETSESTTLSQQKIEHIAESIEKGRFDTFDSYSDEEKEKIKQAVEKDGYTLEYNPDGSGTLSNDEGSWFIGKGWVDNEFTQGVPAPDFGTVTMSAQDKDDDGDFYIFLLREVTAQEASDYVAELEKAGFTDADSKQIDVDAGAVMFDASNGVGKYVSVGFSSNGFTLKIYNNK